MFAHLKVDVAYNILIFMFSQTKINYIFLLTASKYFNYNSTTLKNNIHFNKKRRHYESIKRIYRLQQ